MGEDKKNLLEEFGRFVKNFGWRCCRITKLDWVARVVFGFRLPHWSLVSVSVVLVFLVGVYFKSEVDVVKTLLLESPTDEAGYFELALVAASLGDFEKAEKLVGVGEVLGEVSGGYELVYPVESLEKKISYWESVVEKQSGYGEAYLRLAIYNWQLRNDQTARRYFEEALRLNPNSEKVREVGGLFEPVE